LNLEALFSRQRIDSGSSFPLSFGGVPKRLFLGSDLRISESGYVGQIYLRIKTIRKWV